MKKQKKRTNCYTKTTACHQSPQPPVLELTPEKLAHYVRRAEKQVLPIIEELQFGPGAAQLLIAQCTQVLATGDERISPESALAIANQVLALWQNGYYTPGPTYPYTLEETLADIQTGPKAKADYTEWFEPFTSQRKTPPCGRGKIAAGIVKHPETQLWQIWMIAGDEAPIVFFGAYRDPARAHQGLEQLIEASRKGTSQIEGIRLAQNISSMGDGKAKQLPYDMVVYLMENIQRYSFSV